MKPVRARLGTTHLLASLFIFAILNPEPVMTQPISSSVVRPADAAAADAPRGQPNREPDRTGLYKKTPQGDLKLFAYLPPDWEPSDWRPAIVFFFGGGWRAGTPSQFYRMSEYLAGRGLVAFCAEYRVFDRHQTTPAESVEDARSAIRFIRAHAADWGVDPGRLISAGGSAGGHLAACLGVDIGPDAPDDDRAIPCRPQAMVLCNPVLDTEHERVLGFFSVLDPTERTRLARALSPLAHLDTNCPPAVVFFGTADSLLGAGEPFVRRAQALGRRIDLWMASDMPHGFFNRSPWQESVTRIADEFLTSLGFLSGSPTLPAPTGGVLVGP
jgi:acetyl esterase/lipase